MEKETYNVKLPAWEYILTLLFILYFIIPQSTVVVPFFVALGVEIAFIIIQLFISKGRETRAILAFTITLLFIAYLYTVLNDASSIDSSVANRGLKRFLSKSWQLVSMFFPLLLAYRSLNYASKNQKKVMITVAIIAMLAFCNFILNIIAINPMAARNFGMSHEIDYGPNWVAPYNFVYGMTFSALLFYYISKLYRTKCVSYWIFLALAIFFFYFLFKSQFTLSLVTTILTIVYIYYNESKTKSRKILLIIGVVFSILLLPFMLGLIIPIMPEMLANRFTEIKDFFEGKSAGAEESDMMGRFELYSLALKSFLSSPIWGNRFLEFDGHATYLMIWADLGIIGALPFFKLLLSAKRITEKVMGDMSYLFFPFFLQLLLSGFTNPIHGSLQIDILLWFIVPLTINTVKNNLKLQQ